MLHRRIRYALFCEVLVISYVYVRYATFMPPCCRRVAFVLRCVAVVLPFIVTVVLPMCYCFVAGLLLCVLPLRYLVLPLCYRCAAVMLQLCYHFVPRMLPLHCRCVTVMVSL